MNKHISCLVLIVLINGSSLHAQDSATGDVTNSATPVALDATGPVEQATSDGDTQAAEMISEAAPVTTNSIQITQHLPAGVSEPEKTAAAANFNAPASGAGYPQVPARANEGFIWLALIGALVISLGAVAFTWQAARRNPIAAPAPAAAPLPAHAEATAQLVPNLLPVISQAIKESLMQELAAQRRELLVAQQSAAAELAGLARRLEAVQSPLLERLSGLRPSTMAGAKFHSEMSVKIFCGCGQKYSFEVQPIEGRMPFPVACPACGQDGTHQANQVITRILNGLTQPLPPPNGAPFLNPATPGITPQFVEAVKQAVIQELAPARAEHPKVTAFTVVKENQHEAANPEHRPGDFMASLLDEGQSLADAGELDKAVKCFDTALTLQPERAETRVKLAAVLEKLERVDEALDQYDRAIALDESLTIAYLNKGGLFNRLARYDEALRCYEQALHKQKKSAA